MTRRSPNEWLAQKGNRARPRKIKLGGTEILSLGMPRAYLQDVYHQSMTLSWWAFLGVCALAFISINAWFALLYEFEPGAIANQFPQGYWGAFFFSVETLATVGYGDMHPATVYAHIVSTVEIFFGMAMLALITGVMFARFSRPHARILFAEHPVVSTMDGVKTLIVRAANARQNVIVDASARLRLIRSETTSEGESIRRIYDLKLRRDTQPMFMLGWVLMHVIDEASPLDEQNAQTMADSESFLVLTIDGVDETTSQHMLSRFTYQSPSILWGQRYVDLFSKDSSGIISMDYSLFNATLPESTPRGDPGIHLNSDERGGVQARPR